VSTVQSILNRFDRNGWIYRIEKGRYELDDVELEIALEEMTQQTSLPLAASRTGRPRAKLKQKG
jgi:predicted transcriptional regulator of viral defense system